ncbi:glycosyltransferase, partial [Providencia rettgeri]|nr:glycosyltransferase [Providencia rettgeri]
NDFNQIFKNSIAAQTIYNGHDLSSIVKLSNDKVINDNIDFISIGRITFAKGHFHLLRALSIVKKDFPNVKLYIIGTYEKDNLQSILLDVISKYKLENNVIFTGYKSNPYPYLKKSKALILSSIFEGFPGVVIESLHLGIPVITSNCGGATEVIAGKTAQELTIKHNESLITELGIITPPLNGIYDITANYYNEEIILAKSMCMVLSNEISFDKEVLVSSTYKFNITEMINQYDKILKGTNNERSY